MALFNVPISLVSLCPLLLFFLPNAAFTAQLAVAKFDGSNPTGLTMYEYVPAKVAPRPALLVALHWSGSNGIAMFNTKFTHLADQHGFIVIYPTAPRGSWDVFSPKGLSRCGSDSEGVVSMVRHQIAHRNVDASRVFAVGFSSGGMMTQVLMAEYPDVFAAGSSFAGAPYSCFASPNGYRNAECARGRVRHSAAAWGNAVRDAHRGYRGRRPRLQLWHGTVDTTVSYANMDEAVKQWTNVLGLSAMPVLTERPRVGKADVEKPGKEMTAVRKRYGTSGNQPPLEAITILDGSHRYVVSNTADVLIIDMAARFFGLIP